MKKKTKEVNTVQVIEITTDRTKWENRDMPYRVIDADEALAARVKEECAKWALCVSYDETYDDGERESSISDIRYKELYQPHVLISGAEPVGLMLTETKYIFNSNCTECHNHLLFFDTAGSEIRISGVRHGHRYVEGTAWFSLVPRTSLSERTKIDTSSTQFLTAPNVF